MSSKPEIFRHPLFASPEGAPDGPWTLAVNTEEALSALSAVPLFGGRGRNLAALAIACRGSLAGMWRADAALSVAEAESGRREGGISLVAVVADAAAALELPVVRRPRRLVALGLLAASDAADATRLIPGTPAYGTALGLVDLSARAHGLAGFLAAPASLTLAAPTLPRLDWPGDGDR